MSDEAKILNPEEAERANAILRRPHSVPYGHTDVSEVRKRETIQPSPTRLSDTMTWYFPCLAYSLVAVDKSLFELFNWNIGFDLNPVSFRADKPIASFENVDSSRNAWFYTVQGIDVEHASAFNDFVASFVFKRDRWDWSLDVVETRIRDPFSAEPRGVSCFFFLPRLHNPVKQVVIKKEAGLLLETPILGIHEQGKVSIQPPA